MITLPGLLMTLALGVTGFCDNYKCCMQCAEDRYESCMAAAMSGVQEAMQACADGCDEYCEETWPGVHVCVEVCQQNCFAEIRQQREDAEFECEWAQGQEELFCYWAYDDGGPGGA